MREQKHIVNRHILELTIPEQINVLPIQNQVSEIVRQKLYPALDKVFSKIARKDETIRIDKLIIDIGTIQEKDLENFPVERVVKEIEAQIGRLLKTDLKTKQQNLVNGIRTDSNDNFKINSESKNVLEQFIFFLRKGHFPWWFIQSDSQALEDIFVLVLTNDIKELKNKLVPLFRDPEVRQRLVFQFSVKQLKALLKRIDNVRYESYFALYRELLSCAASTTFKKGLKDNFYEIVFQYFGVEPELTGDEQKVGFLKNVLDLSLAKQSDGEKETTLTEILRHAQNKQQKVSRDTIMIIAAVIQVAIELPSPKLPFQTVIQKIRHKNEFLIHSLVELFSKKAAKYTLDGVSERKEKASALFPPKLSIHAEEIYINNAGLVLIHPFLRYFFEGLNLLDKELWFKSRADAFKAVHLLQFIATGQETSIEIDLPLNKILCGLEVTEPVPKRCPLRKKEKEECIYLIKTILERWEALKTVNPVALRETYLQREGILKHAGKGWKLSIERNAFDVMLEKLPWSISLIRLPWSKQILYVEW